MADYDDEMNCEEVKNEEEKVLRSQINQKLIKKYDLFKLICAIAKTSLSTTRPTTSKGSKKRSLKSAKKLLIQPE